MQPFYFFFLAIRCGGGGGISGRVRALNLTVPLGSDNLGYGPGSGFSLSPCRPLTHTDKKMYRLNVSRLDKRSANM